MIHAKISILNPYNEKLDLIKRILSTIRIDIGMLLRFNSQSECEFEFMDLSHGIISHTAYHFSLSLLFLVPFWLSLRHHNNPYLVNFTAVFCN